MKKSFTLIAAAVVLCTSCASHYHLTSVSRSRILIDSTYDRNPDQQAAAFIAPYKLKVDSMMSPVVGHIARYMASYSPESELSNLMADILLWAGKNYNEQPVFSLYNMGGIRASLSAGPVTYGDILNVAPFENKICFFDLKGETVKKLFEQVAATGGQGISHGVELVISQDRKLISAKINGKEIDPNATYRVTTIDYLAQGNDGLTAFKEKTNVNDPKGKENNARFVIMEYFKEKENKGEVVDSNVEGRIIIK